ncbi:MAG: hypothetical protein AAF745_11135 [Planctomycetota bacterium]
MRIPSQFNDSSLYRPKRGDQRDSVAGRSPVKTSSRHRLIRLTIALLLVIVVMRQAKRPGVYQVFFASSGDGNQQIDGDQQNGQVDAIVDPLPVIDSPLDNRERSPTRWAKAKLWVDRLDPMDQRDWIASLLRAKRVLGNTSNAANTGSSDTAGWAGRGLSTETLFRSLDELSLIREMDPGVVESITADAQEFESALTDGSIDESVSWGRLSWWAEPMLDALDRAALARVKDGTFWTGSDFDAFYLQLARARELDGTGVARTGTLPLLQQPEIYQGQTIRVVGKLGLAERKRAKSNPMGIDSYWKVWVIPDDGGIRPILLIVNELPANWEKCLTSDGKWDRSASPNNPDGDLSAIGRFVKRLPYRSSLGADLAPAVVGRIESRSSRESQSRREAAIQPNGSQNNAAISFGGWLAIATASLAGILLATAIMVRAKQEALRTRKLRHQTDRQSMPSDDAFRI